MKLRLTQLVALLIIGLMTNMATAQKEKTCDPVKLKHMYLKKEQTSKFFAVVIGINNTKEDKAIPLGAVLESSESNVVGTITVIDNKGKESTKSLNPKKDKSGLWTISHDFPVEYSGQEYAISAIRILTITECKDTQVFDALYRNLRKRAKHLRTWEKILSVEQNDLVLQGTVKRRKVKGIEMTGSSISISGGNFEFNDNSAITFSVDVLPNVAENKAVLMALETKDCKGNSKTQNATAKLNEKTGMYEVSTKFDASKTCIWTLEDIKLAVVSKALDTTFFASKNNDGTTMDEKSLVLLMKKTGKSKYVDPCKLKYVLKKVKYTEANVSSIYALNFFFDFEKNGALPNGAALNILLTDCNNKTQNLSVKLNYDTKLGLYVGSQTVIQPKGCKWSLTKGEVVAYNSCKDKFVWTFEASKAKGFGKGTKKSTISANSRAELQ